MPDSFTWAHYLLYNIRFRTSSRPSSGYCLSLASNLSYSNSLTLSYSTGLLVNSLGATVPAVTNMIYIGILLILLSLYIGQLASIPYAGDHEVLEKLSQKYPTNMRQDKNNFQVTVKLSLRACKTGSAIFL